MIVHELQVNSVDSLLVYTCSPFYDPSSWYYFDMGVRWSSVLAAIAIGASLTYFYAFPLQPSYAAGMCYKSDSTPPGTQAADIQCKPAANEIVSKSAPKTSMCGSSQITNIYGKPCTETTSGYTTTGTCVGPQTCCVKTFQRLGGSEIDVQNCSASVLTSGSVENKTNSSVQVPGGTGVAPPTGTVPNTGDTPTPPAPGATPAPASSAGGTSPGATPGTTGGGSPPTAGGGASPGGSGGAPSAAPSTGSTPTPPTPTSVSSAPAPTAPVYNGGPGVESLPQQPQGPFPAPAPQQPAGTYTPVQPTFGNQGQPTPTYISTARSYYPLTNFVSSVGTLASSSNGLSPNLSFFTGLFSVPVSPPAPSYTSSTVVRPQQIFIVNGSHLIAPTTVVSGETPPAQLSPDYFTSPASFSSSETSQAQSIALPQLLDLITGQEPVALAPTTTSTITPDVRSLTPPPAVAQTNANISAQFAPVATMSSAPSTSSLALDMIANLKGEWAYAPQHLQDEASLAQAQSNYAWLQAQIQAMQAAQNAGVCGSTCQSSLATLESEVPQAQVQIQELTGVVNAPPPATFGQAPTTPEQIASQVIGFGPSPAVSNGAPGASQSAGAPPTIGDLASQASGLPPVIAQVPETPPNFIPVAPSYTDVGAATPQEIPPPQTGLEQFASQVWQTVQSWFAPVATSTPARAQSCSLFASLFGGCKGW